MRKINDRIIKLEEIKAQNPDPLRLKVGDKTLTADQYMQLGGLPDFEFVSGDDGIPALCDAGALRWHIFKRYMDGAPYPVIKTNGGMAAEDLIAFTSMICNPMPNRTIEEILGE